MKAFYLSIFFKKAFSLSIFLKKVFSSKQGTVSASRRQQTQLWLFRAFLAITRERIGFVSKVCEKSTRTSGAENVPLHSKFTFTLEIY